MSAATFREIQMLKRLLTGLIVLFVAGLAQAQPTAGVEYRQL